jgi:hypothetical protein
MVRTTHSSQNTANEYDAKHEPDVAKKMANLWENKVNENDGGKLSPLFAQSPDEVAANRKKAAQPTALTAHPKVVMKTLGTSETGLGRSNSKVADADPGPAGVSRKKPVVDVKNKYERGGKVGGQESVEQKVKEAAAAENAKAAAEAKRVEEQRTKDREARRVAAGETFALLQKQMEEMNKTVAELKAQMTS